MGDLPNTSIDWENYTVMAQNYLNRGVFKGTPLTGQLLTNSAKKTYEQTGDLIPFDFALSQAQWESSMGRKGRSPTNNPFNVGEFDEGTKMKFKSTQEGVQKYYDLVANDYLVGDKTIEDLLSNYVNFEGNRYASDENYETKIKDQMNFINKFLSQ